MYLSNKKSKQQTDLELFIAIWILKTFFFGTYNSFKLINIDNGPKKVRIFINQTRSLDFDSAVSAPSIQDLE